MRRAFLIAGLLTLALIWAGPLLSAWRASFAAHMVAHMGVVAVAAPLIAIGLGRYIDRLADTQRSVVTSLPIVASLVDLVVVWGWHAPTLRALANGSVAATVVEQAMFLGAGLLLWATAFAGGDRQQPAQAAAGAFSLLFTSVHMTLLGALLALSRRPLFGDGAVTCFGLTLEAGEDQVLGGVVMLTVGAVVYLCGGLVLMARILHADPDKAQRS